MLDLEVRPERSLGCDQWEFILGMHFSQAVAIIQSQVGIIKGVQVLYSDTDPLGVDIVINLPQDGIRLIFDPVVQRMKGIEVFNMKLVKLKYCGLPFSSPEVAPSIEQIEHSFGATHPGVYDAAKQLFALHFRGLSFYFPVDSKLQPGYAHGLGSLHFPNGSSPVVAKMSLYSGGNAAETRVTPALPLSCYNQQLYVDSVQILRNACGTKGIRLQLYTEGSVRVLEPRKQTITREVMFGDTCQDVASSLGCPNRVFFKSEDKMKIHSPNAHRGSQHRRSDYFFNYFTLGLDLLFDARTQRCKKIILHTNYPGHYNYNMYHRCEFQLQLPADKACDMETTGTPVTVSAYSKWDKISARLAPSDRPVVLHRASSTNTANPFGSTFCYGYQDIIFEVMSNNYIASVTLYSSTPYPSLWCNGKAATAVGNLNCMSSSMTASTMSGATTTMAAATATKLQALNHNHHMNSTGPGSCNSSNSGSNHHSGTMNGNSNNNNSNHRRNGEMSNSTTTITNGVQSTTTT